MALRSAVALLVCGAGGAFHAPALASRRAAVPRALAALQLDDEPPQQLHAPGAEQPEPPPPQHDAPPQPAAAPVIIHHEAEVLE